MKLSFKLISAIATMAALLQMHDMGHTIFATWAIAAVLAWLFLLGANRATELR
jgi:hypothetical protein